MRAFFLSHGVPLSTPINDGIDSELLQLFDSFRLRLRAAMQIWINLPKILIPLTGIFSAARHTRCQAQ